MAIIKFLKNNIRQIIHADIVKVFSFTSISTIIKMITGFISIKVVAVIIGPSGIALLGQLNNFCNIGTTIATGGLNSGITKYVSEYKSSNDHVRSVISNAFYITVVLSLLCGICFTLFAEFISKKLLADPGYDFIIVIFGLTLIFYSLNNLLLSVLNGYKDLKRYVIIGIISSLVGLIFTITLVLAFKLNGAMIAAVTYQSVIFFITLYMVSKLPWFHWRNFAVMPNASIIRKYFNYSLMTFVNVATIPISQIIIRSYSINNLSIELTGQWEAMNRISGMYLLVITSSFLVYYLPRLAELNTRSEIINEVTLAFKVMFPALLIAFTIIYAFRHLIIQILFTSDFKPVTDLFLWQLIGDLFKMSSWLLTFVMVAKSMTSLYIITEIICYTSLTALSIYFAKINGIIGITQAYMINYILYAVLIVLLFKKLLKDDSKYFPV